MRGKKVTSIRGHLLNQTVLVVVAILASAIIVRADGGSVLWQRTTGPITVTAFTTQSPLRPGPSDISFLVEDTEQSRPILDARVFIALENENGVTLRGEATHAQARNKLLYCGLIDLPKSGHWKMTVLVAHAGERTEFISDLAVSAPQSPIIGHWKLMTFPPAIIILFVINQWLRRNRRVAIRSGLLSVTH